MWISKGVWIFTHKMWMCKMHVPAKFLMKISVKRSLGKLKWRDFKFESKPPHYLLILHHKGMLVECTKIRRKEKIHLDATQKNIELDENMIFFFFIGWLIIMNFILNSLQEKCYKQKFNIFFNFILANELNTFFAMKYRFMSLCL